MTIQSKLYRVLTENKNREKIEEFAACGFDAFTIYEATGYWRGTRESTLVIEVSGIAIEMQVSALARLIAVYNGQECVLVQEIETNSRLIYAK